MAAARVDHILPLVMFPLDRGLGMLARKTEEFEIAVWNSLRGKIKKKL